MTELPSGTVTFLFTDIEGSTVLLSTLGDSYAELIGEHRRIVSEIVERFGGVVYGAFADEISAVFPAAADAVSTAGLGQRSLAAATLPGGVRVRLRMGVHTGRPIARRAEYLGLDVHRTARICAAGHGGQVLLSQDAHAALEGRTDAGVAFRELGSYELKGLPEPERIFQLLIAGVRNEFPPLRTGANSAAPPELPQRRPKELVRSLQAAMTTLRARRYAKDLEHDVVVLSEPFMTGHSYAEKNLARWTRRDSRDR